MIDLADLRLEVQATFAEIIEGITADLAEPMLVDALAMRWMTMPPDQKEMVKQNLPKTYARIMQLVTP